MPRTYRVAQIGPNQIDRAYPLVETVEPSLDLKGWRALCGEVAGHRYPGAEGDKIIVATNPLGYVQGLCVAAVKESTPDGRVLDVPIFAVASAADEAGVVAGLLDYLRDCGRNETCGSIRIWTLAQDNWSRHLDETAVKRWDHGVLMLLDAGQNVSDGRNLEPPGPIFR